MVNKEEYLEMLYQHPLYVFTFSFLGKVKNVIDALSSFYNKRYRMYQGDD
jgi:hypothetical protein